MAQDKGLQMWHLLPISEVRPNCVFLDQTNFLSGSSCPLVDMNGTNLTISSNFMIVSQLVSENGQMDGWMGGWIDGSMND